MRIIETQIGESLGNIIEKDGLDIDDPSLHFILPDIPAVAQAEKFFYKKGLWGDRLLTFGNLASLADLRSEKRYIELPRMGRLFLIEEVVRELSPGFLYFKETINIKGFSQALVRIIAELKHMKLTSNQILEIAETVEEEGLKNKLNDLGGVFNLYQKKLDEEGLVDDIDRLRILSDFIKGGKLISILPDAGTFVVFGFYDFTHSQLEVLKSINDTGYELLIYLPNLTHYPALRNEVMAKITDWSGDFEVGQIPPASKPQIDIKIFSYPSFREESEFTVREIKRLILEESFKPDDICVILRSIAEKENYLIRGFEKLCILYSMPGGLSIGTSSFGQFIINLLKAKSENFERRLVINFLRSPYIIEFLSKVDDFEGLILELDFESRNRKILRGLSDWKIALQEIENEGFVKCVESILEILNKRFNSKDLCELCTDLAEVLDELLVHKALESLSDKSYIYEIIWEQFSGFLRELTFLNKIRFKRDIGSLREFISLLEDLLYEQNFPASTPTKTEKVRILEAFAARGTVFPVVFILDVGEKSFPSPFVRDPILKNDERALINSYLGKEYFRVEKSHYDSEDFLFKSVSSSATAKLYVTYSYLDEKERSKLPSYLVEELIENEKVEVKRRNLEDGLLSQDGICTKGDLIRHLFYTGQYDNESFAGYLSDNWNPYRWVSGGIQAESSRLAPDGVYCCHEGIITKKELLTDLMKCSPTRLETYGDCPFRYFAGTILGLKVLEEVEDEVSLFDLGSFYHKVLGELFKLLAKRMGGKVDMRKIKDEDLIKTLNRILGEFDFDEELPGLSTMMREIIKIRVREEVLPQFVLAEAERIRKWNEKGFYPAYVEKVLNINIGGIETKAVADRVDIGQQGALIIDYKLRSSSSRKFSSYRHLQLPLYLSALKSEGLSPYGGYYRFVERPDDEKGSDKDGKDFEEHMESAWGRAEMYIGLMKQGFFAPVVVNKVLDFEKGEIELSKEGDGCKWCDFWDLCRVREGVKRRL